MKNFTLAFRAFFVSLLMLLTMWGSAQNPTYENRLMNDTLIDANTYEFDIYLLRTGATAFELATYQMGLYFDPVIANGGTITASVVAGYSDLAASQQPTTVSIASGASGKFCMLGIPYSIIRLAAKTPPGPGNGTIISNTAPGTRVGRIRLTNTVAFGQAIPIKCFNFEPTPYNTVVRAYVGGTNTDVTIQASHFITDLTNPLLNAPVPVFNVTGGGNAPAAVGLDGSTIGIRYWVLRDGVSTQWPTNGTGMALDFNGSPFTLGGTYTSKGWRKATYLQADMTGNAVVVACVVPTVYNVTGGGSYCSHMGSTVPVFLSGSEVGHDYQLKKDGVLYGAVVPGTGAALNFPNLPGGTYGIVGDPGTSCETDMNGTVVITEITSPVVYNVFGGGPYCAGGTGMTVSLDGSQVGVKYQLKKNTVDEGLPLDGNGGMLSWNNMTTGNYTVNAYFPGFVCEINMAGNVNVWEEPVPTPYTMSGGGTTCNTPTTFQLDNSQVGYFYSVYRNGGDYQLNVPGTGAALVFNNAPDGLYNIIATNPSGLCPSPMTNTVTITYEIPPTAYMVGGTGVYCSGGLGLPVTLSNSQIGVNYQLKQNGVDFGAPMAGTGGMLTWNNNPAGTYTIVGTNAAGLNCSADMTGNAVITAENPVAAAGVIAGPATVTQFDLGVAYSVPAITNATSYHWSTTGTDWTINGSGNAITIDFGAAATNGTLSVYGSNSCGNGVQSDKAITVNPLIGGTITIDNVTPVNPTCNGGATGTITIAITAVGTVNPILYSVDNGATWFNNGGNFTGLVAGSYNIKVKDSGVATATWAGNPVVLTNPPALVISNVAKTNVTCNGANDGTITITASGGTGALQYSIDNGVNYQASNFFNNLLAGNYFVRVKDANNCVVAYASNPVVIIQPSAITISSVDVTQITCNGANNGSIFINATGGTNPKQYSIDNGVTWQAAVIFVGLPGGTYNVKIKDANNCMVSYVGNPIVIIDPPALVITNVATTNVSCNGGNNGTITITASGGTGALEYSKDAGVTWQASNVFTGLAAGYYHLRVKDANGCITPYPGGVQITQPTSISISQVSKTNVTCNGANDGTITITAAGGTPPLQYSIYNGATWQMSNVFNNLNAGNYYVKIKDNNGCELTYANNPVVITEPAPLVFSSVTFTNVTCNGANNGTITAIVAGGTAPYQYSIDNGTTWVSNGGMFTNLAPGNYNLRVKDYRNCQTFYAGNPIVIQQPTALLITNVASTNVTCNGGNNGSITITASGGVTPYQFTINGGTTYQASNVFNNLTAGTYVVRVKDANNCITSYASNPVFITQPSAITISNVTVTNVGCFGTNTGSIGIAASGGTPPLQYSIDNGTTWQTSNIFQNLTVGTYNIKVKDASNCQVSYAGNPVNLTGPPAIIISNVAATNVYCYGGSTGSIFITASGGTGALTYSIDNGATYYSNGGFFTGLMAGTYNVIVKDASGCTQAYAGNPVILSQPPEIVIASVTSTNVTCGGYDDGTITVVASGGTGELFYSIDGGYTWLNNGGLFTDLAAGTYEVRVMDEIGCFVLYADNPVVITEPDPIVIDNVVATDATCNGCMDGTITITAHGGTGALEYSIDDGANWQGTGYFDGLAAGDYLVKVKDSEGCELSYASNPVVIDEPPVGIPDVNTVIIINVYPNPTDGIFTLDIKGISQVLQIQIMNLEGKMVAEKRGPFGAGDIKMQFNLSNEPKGQYMVRIIEQNSVHVRKVVVQ